MNDNLNANGQQFLRLVQEARFHERSRKNAEAHEQTVHIVGAGATLTAAYEQLRNAAEYAEENTLLQRAIRRFYRRLFFIGDKNLVAKSGEELAIELTQAGYIENDSLPESIVASISRLAQEYHGEYDSLGKTNVSQKQREAWTLDVLSVKIEWLLNDPAMSSAYVQFVHQYYFTSENITQLFRETPNELEAALYVAVHRSLLKSDNGVVRAALLEQYQLRPNDKRYVVTNQQLDVLFASPVVEKLFRHVDRYGAPFRVIRHMMENDDFELRLERRDEFISHFESQVESDYSSINQRINRGIIKSVVFLIITKVIIGLGIEIPYDYFLIGAIAVTPLIINLLFPPLYMILLRTTLMLPDRANTRRLSQQAETILYGQEQKQLRRRSSSSFGIGFNIAYVLGFIIVFGGIGYWLYASFGFELVHLFVFFLFLSGASFLGFRLSRMIREIEAVDSEQNAVTTVRDFLYIPFVVVGRYMSEKYAQVNIVALTLDMVIELPLKTILRLVRQWAAFITSKKDEL